MPSRTVVASVDPPWGSAMKVASPAGQRDYLLLLFPNNEQGAGLEESDLNLHPSRMLASYAVAFPAMPQCGPVMIHLTVHLDRAQAQLNPGVRTRERSRTAAHARSLSLAT